MPGPVSNDIYVVQSQPTNLGTPDRIFKVSSAAVAGATLVQDPSAGSLTAMIASPAVGTGLGWQLGIDETGAVHKFLTAR